MVRIETYANRCALTLALLFPAFIAMWLLAKPLPPLQDLPVWVYQGWLGAQLLHGHAAALQPFIVVHYPVPNMFAQILLTGLSALVGPLIAAKLTLALLLGSATGVCLLAAHRMHAARTGLLALLLLSLVATGTMFWNGFLNFEFSLVILLAYLAMRDRATPRWIVATGLLLFVCHASTFAAFALLVTLEVVLERGSFLRLAALLPGVALLAWYAVGRHHTAMQPESGSLYTGVAHYIEYKAYTLTKFGPFHNLVDYKDASFAARAHGLYMAGVALNVLFALIGAWAVVPSVARELRQEPRNAPLVSAVLLFLGFLLLPGVIFNEVNLGERFMYASLLFALVQVRHVPKLRVLAVLSACGMVLTIGQITSMPTARTASPLAPAAAPWGTRQAYEKFGLYDSRLYQLDQYRIFLQQPDKHTLPPLFFDTSLLLERNPEPRH